MVCDVLWCWMKYWVAPRDHGRGVYWGGLRRSHCFWIVSSIFQVYSHNSSFVCIDFGNALRKERTESINLKW